MLEAQRDQDMIFPLSQFAFQYELSKEELEKKVKEAERHVIWGMFAAGELAAKTHLLPLSVYIHGKAFDMGGVSSVATWPEYRRNGLVKQLLKTALDHMRQHGQTISFLFPFSFGFYRRYGWELVFSDVECDIPITTFKKQWGGSGYIRRIQQDDIRTLEDVYNTYAKQYTGMLKRDERWWRERILKDNQHIAVAYDEADRAIGYVIYTVKKETFTVRDIAFTNNNARKLLYHFISQHDSMAEKVKMTVPENDPIVLHAEDPRFEQKINPYFMARIVDVHNFLKDYPFAPATKNVTLNVQDDFLPENGGTFQLNPNGDHVKVTAVSAPTKEMGITCTIQQLTMMLLGFKRPGELSAAGLLEADANPIEALEELIPRQQPYLADFF
nr:GNAT family N-acetyltransferase [Lentibacillus sp. JNUCC-1]